MNPKTDTTKRLFGKKNRKGGDGVCFDQCDYSSI